MSLDKLYSTLRVQAAFFYYTIRPGHRSTSFQLPNMAGSGVFSPFLAFKKLCSKAKALIVKFLTWEDMIHLSFVTNEFETFALQEFWSIEQVKLQFEPEDSLFADRSLVMLMNERLVTLNFKYTAEKGLILKFLAANCPNLNVLDAATCCIEHKVLMLFSKRLKYFSCYAIIDPYSTFRLRDFPNLKAFDIIDPVSNRLWSASKDVPKVQTVIGNYYMEISPNETWLVDHLVYGIRSLKIEDPYIRTIEIPKILAQTLEVVYLQGVNLKKTVFLPNLKLLKVVNPLSNHSGISILESVESSTRLKVLSIKVCLTNEKCELLSLLFLQWEDLEFLDCKSESCDSIVDSPIYIPHWKNLFFLKISVRARIVFSQTLPNNLINIDITANSVEEITFEYKNLKLKTFLLDVLKNQNLFPILTFLSGCKSLKSVQINFRKDVNSVIPGEIPQLLNHEMPFSRISTLCAGENFVTDRPYMILKFKWPRLSEIENAITKLPFEANFAQRFSMSGSWQTSQSQIIATVQLTSFLPPFSVKRVIQELAESFNGEVDTTELSEE